MIIEDIQAIPLNMSYKPELAPHLGRSGLRAYKGRMSLYRVELKGGVVGYGDSMGGPDDLSALVGSHAVSGLRTILHPGVQMACYDAVGRALDLPAHALMGRQVRPRVPFAYWTAELPPEVWAAQARQAVEMGYRVYKFKCRPWWDPIEQLEQAAAAVPEGFKFWLDFNGHLREARLALPLAVKPARPSQGRIQYVHAIGSGNDDDLVRGVEAVHFNEYGIKGLFSFVMPTAAEGCAATSTDGVDFVQEDDAGGVILGLFEQISNAGCPHADEHFHEIASGDGEERDIGLSGDGLGQQSFSAAGFADQEHSAWNSPAESLEPLGISEELDDLGYLFLGFLDAGYVVERNLGLILVADAVF